MFDPPEMAVQVEIFGNFTTNSHVISFKRLSLPSYIDHRHFFLHTTPLSTYYQSDDYLRDSISHKCDVEGLCHTYRTNLYRNVRYLDYPYNTKKCVLPCTALSVVKILESVNTTTPCYDKNKPVGRHMEGNVVTIINRSEIVGRPLAAMLANDGADVYSVDINSIYLFRGGTGRLHKVEEGETVESCVRKVSSYFLHSFFQ